MMKRTVVGLCCVAALIFEAGAAPVTDWKEVSKTLNAIPTAAGVSLGKRLNNCHATVNKSATWMETRNVPWPDYAAKPGQTVLMLVFDLPPPDQTGGPGPATPQQKNIKAIWIIDKGKATPLSSWASALQNRPVPLGYDKTTNC